MVFGPSMSGKSFFIFDMAAAVALGRPWRDHKVKQGAVAYVVAEGAGGFPNRLRAYLAHHGVSAADLPVFEIPEAPNLLEKGDVKELVADLRGVDGLRLVIVDTLAQATPGADENSSKDMGLALAHCKAIGEATGALVLLVGHTGKDESRGVRGHSSQIAAFDVAIQVEQVDDYRAATVRKLKDGQEGDEFAFHLQGVVVGQDEDGDPVTSCVALPGNKHGATRPDKRRKPKGQWQELVLDVATALTDMPGSVSKATLFDAAIQRAGELGRFDMERSRDRVRDAFRKLADNGLLTDAGGHIAVL